MKKILYLFLPFFLLASCSQQAFNTKEVCVVIPTHPWELEKTNLMWYSLKYNCDGQIKHLYVDTTTREVRIKIPKDQTVIVCAFPLDDMHPFAAAFSPVSPDTLILDQNQGYLAEMILGGALEVAGDINFDKLVQKAKDVSHDLRQIDEAVLIADILNGDLKDSSFVKTPEVEIGDVEVYSGTWISENCNDLFFDPDDVQLPIGVHRFFNVERSLEMELIVNADGTYSKYEERSLIPLSN